jgi:hypothetical protein
VNALSEPKLTEAEREALRVGECGPCAQGTLDVEPCRCAEMLRAAVESILRDRLAPVEAERDAYRSILDRHSMRWCLCSRADRMHDRARDCCPIHGEPRHWLNRAEAAEHALAARDEVIARVRALHTGLHRCTDGWYWIEQETQGCKGAKVGLCPTLAVLDGPAPQPDECIHCGRAEDEHGEAGACLRPGYCGNRFTPPTTDAEEAQS